MNDGGVSRLPREGGAPDDRLLDGLRGWLRGWLLRGLSPRFALLQCGPRVFLAVARVNPAIHRVNGRRLPCCCDVFQRLGLGVDRHINPYFSKTP